MSAISRPSSFATRASSAALLVWKKLHARTASILSSLRLGDCTIDGELVALDDKGQGSFSRMQQQADNPSIELVYYVFDLLNDHGVDIRTLPLAEPKADTVNYAYRRSL